MTHEKKAVLFTKKYGGYNSGEVATFGVRKADKLITGGVAKPFTSRAPVVTKDGETPPETVEPATDGEEKPKTRRRRNRSNK